MIDNVYGSKPRKDPQEADHQEKKQAEQFEQRMSLWQNPMI